MAPPANVALDYTAGQVPNPSRSFDNEKCWAGADLSPDDWLLPIPTASLAELERVVAALRHRSLPPYLLRSDLFELDQTVEHLREARRRAYDGIGFVVLDRLPLDEWSKEEATAVMWLLLSQISQPVAQTADGQMFLDVRETPAAERSQGNQGLTQGRLTCHTDNSGNPDVPNFTALLGIHAAAAGGLSEYTSLYALYNAMLRDAPVELDRLFQPFFHRRQGLTDPDETPLLWAPAICFDGDRLMSRFSFNKITNGYRIAGEELDALGREAIEAGFAIIEEKKLAAEYMLERGQLLIFNNREGLHHRQAFVNGDTEDKQRWLIRMWLRDEGRPFFSG